MKSPLYNGKPKEIRYYLSPEEVQTMESFNLWQAKEDRTTFTEVFMWFQAFMSIYTEHDYEVIFLPNAEIMFIENTYDDGTKIGIAQRTYDGLPESLEYIHEKLTNFMIENNTNYAEIRTGENF